MKTQKNVLQIEELIDVINNEFCPARKINEQDIDVHLLGEEIDFEPRDLLLLVYMIEKRVSIKVTEKIINEVGFGTMGQIIDAVNKAVVEYNENCTYRQ
ncbi:MAG: hypothetical protein VB031_04785 [Eubacteriaceae bacterium]|nr:hypothetical protein [Eubacteriaceae bacterium]